MKNKSLTLARQEVLPLSELSLFRLDASTDHEVLEALAARALAAGRVRPSFAKALIEREAAYPTGLPTVIPVAIPHADVEHVLKSGLGIALLKNPVTFGEMGSDGGTVEARLVVLILVTQPEQQVTLLTKLIDVFQQPGWFDAVDGTTDVEELAQTFARLL